MPCKLLNVEKHMMMVSRAALWERIFQKAFSIFQHPTELRNKSECCEGSFLIRIGTFKASEDFLFDESEKKFEKVFKPKNIKRIKKYVWWQWSW